MNNLLKYFRILLTILLMVFISIFMYKTIKSIIKIDAYGISYQLISICFIFFIFLVFTIKDIIKKEIINTNSWYNVLSCIALLIVLLIFLRVLYDPSFIVNVKEKLDIPYFKTYFFQYSITYIESHTLYINLLFILIMLYRHINLKSTK